MDYETQKKIKEQLRREANASLLRTLGLKTPTKPVLTVKAPRIEPAEVISLEAARAARKDQT